MRKFTRDFSVKSIVSILLASMFILSSISMTTRLGFSGGIFPGPGAGTATIYVDPKYNNYTHPPTDIGDTFSVTVRIADYTNVSGWQAKLEFDKTYLNTTTANITYAAISDFVFPAGTYPPIPAAVGTDPLNASLGYALMTTTTYGAVEYENATGDNGLMIARFKIIAVPPDGATYSTLLTLEPFDTWTIDTNIDENTEIDIDGYYQIKTPLILPYLAVGSETLPTAPGDRVIGDHFKLDIDINDVPVSKHIILVQYAITYDPDYLNLVWLWEGTFMNNSLWAPYGTFDNITIKDYEGYVSSFIMINPNLTTGEWDWNVFPEGNGLLAQVEFEVVGQPKSGGNVVTDIKLEGVFAEFFVTDAEEYSPYNPPQNGTFTIGPYNWDYPVASFTYTPSLPELNETIIFDASASYGFRNTGGTLTQDPTMITSYMWDFGDGNTTTVSTPTIIHSYPSLDLYNVTLTVIDEYGENNTTFKLAQVVEILIHPITYQTQTFTVITVSNGHILPVPMHFDQPKRMLYFNITGSTGMNGFINITIPNTLLNAAPDEWAVIAGETLVQQPDLVVVTLNATHTMLHIPMTFSTHYVYIIGTGVVPELPVNNITLMMLGLFFAASAVLGLSLQKKRKTSLN